MAMAFRAKRHACSREKEKDSRRRLEWLDMKQLSTIFHTGHWRW